MSNATGLLKRALEELEIHGEVSTWDLIKDIRTFLAAEKEADDILDRAIASLESTTLEITNITAFRDRVIDECIEAVGLGICRDGRNTSHYQQSQRHLEALRKLKTTAAPSRKPMTDEEIQKDSIFWLLYDQKSFVAGVRYAEKHHGIGGDDGEHK